MGTISLEINFHLAGQEKTETNLNEKNIFVSWPIVLSTAIIAKYHALLNFLVMFFITCNCLVSCEFDTTKFVEQYCT